MRLILSILAAIMFVSMIPKDDEPIPCKQAKELRERLGDNLDGLMKMPSDTSGLSTDSLITLRQWVEMLEAKCDSIKNANN